MATARYVTNPFSKPVKVGSLTFQPGETQRLHRNWVFRNYPEDNGLKVYLTPPDNWETPQAATPPKVPAKEEITEVVVVSDPITESEPVVEDEVSAPPAEDPVPEEEPETVEVEAGEEDDVWTLEELSTLKKADLREILTESDVEFDPKASKKQLVSLILGD